MEWLTCPMSRIAPVSPAAIRFRDADMVWHLGLEHIESHTGAVTTKVRAPAARAGSSTLPFDNGNVLYSKLRPYLNKVVVPDEPGIATTELLPLRPNPDLILREFLAYYLRSRPFLSFASQFVAGAKMPRLLLDKFWAHEMPLPPLSEQHRIVEILDHANHLRRLHAEADAKAGRILSALFIKMFGDPATNPMRWPLCSLGALSRQITSGSRGWAKYAGRGAAFFVRTQDIDDGEIATKLLPIDPPAGAESERARLSEGDVVVTITGVVGKAAVVRESSRDLYVSQHVALIRPRLDRVLAEYLAAYANLPLGEVPVLARFQYGQTKPGLGFRELRAASIPLPPMQIQRTFSEQALSVRGLRNGLRDSQRQLRWLWDRVVDAAFSGSLTASWRQAHLVELIHEMELQLAATASSN